MKPYRGGVEETFSAVMEGSIHIHEHRHGLRITGIQSLFAIRASWGDACVLPLEKLARCTTETKTLQRTHQLECEAYSAYL